MKIDELPIEMLMTIFSHLRTLKNVSLVNRRFYDAACKVSYPRMCLQLLPPYLEDDYEDRLKYIRKTTRKIANLVIEMRLSTKKEYIPITSVIGKFTPNIKKLTIRGQFRFSDILDILSMASNAEFIEFRAVRIMKNHDGSQPSLPNDTNEDLNLTNLKTLKIMSCSREVAAIFNRLPKNVLTELVLRYQNLVELNDLFKQQGTIKTLTITYWDSSGNQFKPLMVPADIFDNQKLEALRCTLKTFWNSNFDLILSKQKSLKSLEVNSRVLENDFMNAVTNHLPELEKLRMHGGMRTRWSIIKNIEKLRKLKYLQLELGSDPDSATQLEEFATFDHSSISTFRIRLGDIPRHILVAVAKSAPNLKVLHFLYQGRQNIHTTLTTMLEIFNFVERFSFTHYGGSIDGSLSQCNCVNLKLIELNIGQKMRLDIKSLETFIECYSNLRRLSLDLKDFTVFTMKSILNGFKKLESMTLEVYKPYFDANASLDCLRKDGKNLKFVEIYCCGKWNLNAEIKAELSAIYEVVEFSDGTLRMGVDRKVMEERESESTYKYDLNVNPLHDM